MERVAPAGPMYQAGTLSGNPLAMTAGIHTLKRLQEPGSYIYLNKITGELVQGIIDTGEKGRACDVQWVYTWHVWVFFHRRACLQLLGMSDSTGEC